jgi:hypothetical protein
MPEWKSGEWADVPSASPVPVEPVNTKLSVVLPFIESEMVDVEKLLQRSLELSGQITRTLFLLPFKGLEIKEIKKLAEKAFAQVGVIKDGEGITSDWQGRDRIRSAAGPNSLFRQAAWFFYFHRQHGSWLWLEPDCMPMTSRWLYDLERDHFDAGKPFTGVKMQLGDGREYMNGVGIYPWNAIQYAPILVQSTMWKQHPDLEVGFDVAGGAEVLKRTHLTKLIQLTNHLATEKVEVRPETVLCHGRVNLSGGAGNSVDEQRPPVTLDTTVAQLILGASAVQGDPASVVSDKAILPPSPCSAHESRTQEPSYGSVSSGIRDCVDQLVYLWNNQPHRKVLIVKELRKAKLVPKHFR